MGVMEENERLFAGGKAVAYTVDLDLLVPFSDFSRHIHDTSVHFPGPQVPPPLEITVLDNLSTGSASISFAGEELEFRKNLQLHTSDIDSGAPQGVRHITELERAFVDSYPDEDLTQHSLVYENQLTDASFDLYGALLEASEASTPAIQINVNAYVDQRFFTRQQLRAVNTVTLQAQREERPGTGHIWSKKQYDPGEEPPYFYLNILVNEHTDSEGRTDGKESDDGSNYRWLGCSSNGIDTYNIKYGDPIDPEKGIGPNTKYQRWNFDESYDLSDADYIVLAFSRKRLKGQTPPPGAEEYEEDEYFSTLYAKCRQYR